MSTTGMAVRRRPLQPRKPICEGRDQKLIHASGKGHKWHLGSSTIEGVACTLRVSFNELIPLPGFHRGSVNCLHIVFVKLRLRRISVSPTLDNTPSAPLFLEILVDAHRGQVVAGSEYTLL